MDVKRKLGSYFVWEFQGHATVWSCCVNPGCDPQHWREVSSHSKPLPVVSGFKQRGQVKSMLCAGSVTQVSILLLASVPFILTASFNRQGSQSTAMRMSWAMS